MIRIPEELQKIIRDDVGPCPYLALLYALACKSTNILELGLARGRSTRALLMGCRDGKGHLTTFDRAKDAYGNDRVLQEAFDEALSEIKCLGLEKYWTWIRKYETELDDDWFINHKFDLIFIDIDPWSDITEAVRKVSLSMKDGSILLMHNVVYKPDVYKVALEQLLSTGKYVYEEMEIKHGLGKVVKVKD